MQVALQAVLNVAVVTNTIPNTGISLPFFYGTYRTREHKTLRLASRQIAETPVRRIRQIEQ